MSEIHGVNCYGDWVLSAPQSHKMLDKYMLPSKKLSFVEKKTGSYYAFRSPNNQVYLLNDEMFPEKMIGPNIKKMLSPSMLRSEDTFRINNAECTCILQYKQTFQGDYYIYRTKNGMRFIISGLDINTLPSCERARAII